ncbi:MAG: 4Fe-4S dicluster domain-containing protein [Deltaproteobacteria bacterium]|nr:4Fe-4S dicluster domain-containing protein [Deltaproteobacteria bacterium]
MAVKVDKTKCDGCGTCAEVCPVEAIGIEKIAVIDFDECLECFACVDQCPVGALLIEEEQDQQAAVAGSQPPSPPPEALTPQGDTPAPAYASNIQDDEPKTPLDHVIGFFTRHQGRGRSRGQFGHGRGHGRGMGHGRGGR